MSAADPELQLDTSRGATPLSVPGQVADLLERIADGFIALDNAWCITWVNTKAECMNRMSRGDMLGRNYWELFPAAQGTALESELLRCAEQHIPVELESYYAPWKRWFHFKAYPDSEGGVSVFFEDITDRKGIQQALRESEEQLRAIFETTPECVKIVASDGTLLQMNESGLCMLGSPSADAVIGRSIYDLVAPEFRQEYIAFHERVCRGERGTFEFEITDLTGRRRHLESHAAPLR